MSTHSSQVLERNVSKDLPCFEADLNYLAPMAERPINYTYEPPAGTPRHNGTYAAQRLPIHNARAIAQDLSLEREGFAFVNHQSVVRDFYNSDEVHRVYYPEAERLLKEVTGASRVVVFDRNVRNALRAQRGENVKEPVKRVHNDFTAKSGYSRARIELEARNIDNYKDLLQQRFAVVNVWRPIAEPVQESPLALCDAQSIALTDLVASDLVYRDRVGETYAVTYNPAHQWFYFPQQQRNEVILIKCFDTKGDGSARFAAHTGFDDPTSPPDASHRESIELRTLVFYGT
ncbi:CmcJ/NvfI family oxidoreductase [Tumidithrix elongata RA019]|uniref:CmcJ/NvfI family oxidoreductase n=1 Tax=Tumidithrix elongata BACA0141 TaxID=2716417 RepID=A0AAW9PXE1_9CYAN|nr:CmcJ/NvfI family oxidoreductase [Tumidithrix elongata RA019]